MSRRGASRLASKEAVQAGKQAHCCAGSHICMPLGSQAGTPLSGSQPRDNMRLRLARWKPAGSTLRPCIRDAATRTE